MARIKITDLPKDRKISREEMKKIMGGDHHWSKPSFLTNPWFLGAAIAVAIALPIAIDDSDDAS